MARVDLIPKPEAMETVTLAQHVDNYFAKRSDVKPNAGLEPWPKLFQNLRESLATELAGEFPGHVAAAWMGHSTKVASNHYWQVTDADFAKAIVGGAQAAQNPAQSVHATSRTEPHAPKQAHDKALVLPVSASPCDTSQNQGAPQAGIEPATPGLGNRCSIP